MATGLVVVEFSWLAARSGTAIFSIRAEL